MKIKTLQLLFVMMTVASSFAQTEKGKFLIGLNTPLSFSSTSQKIIIETSGEEFDNDKTTNFNFTSQVGYGIINNLFLGVDFTLFFSNVENYSRQTNSTTYIIAPTAKYYFPLEKKISLLGKVRYGFGNSNVVLEDSSRPNDPLYNREIETNIENFQTGLGVAYFISNKINIELSLNYDYSLSEEYEFIDVTYISNSFGASIGFSLFL